MDEEYNSHSNMKQHNYCPRLSDSRTVRRCMLVCPIPINAMRNLTRHCRLQSRICSLAIGVRIAPQRNKYRNGPCAGPFTNSGPQAQWKRQHDIMKCIVCRIAEPLRTCGLHLRFLQCLRRRPLACAAIAGIQINMASSASQAR